MTAKATRLARLASLYKPILKPSFSADRKPVSKRIAKSKKNPGCRRSGQLARMDPRERQADLLKRVQASAEVRTRMLTL